jgi:hypothetical protein
MSNSKSIVFRTKSNNLKSRPWRRLSNIELFPHVLGEPSACDSAAVSENSHVMINISHLPDCKKSNTPKTMISVIQIAEVFPFIILRNPSASTYFTTNDLPLPLSTIYAAKIEVTYLHSVERGEKRIAMVGGSHGN